VKSGNLWDIFCRVIDNYGDIGVCWRLAVGLAARGQQVRLWADDASALRWMAPGGAAGVEVRAWDDARPTEALLTGDVLIEAFGCEVEPHFRAAFIRKMDSSAKPNCWINLEYLSAENYVENCHGLPSPVIGDDGHWVQKHFFYPGFTDRTGGLLRETDLIAQQAHFERDTWMREQAISHTGERLISLFCYEPTALAALLTQLANDPVPTRLLVTAGRASAAVNNCVVQMNEATSAWNRQKNLLITHLPPLGQRDFDRLLWSCDLNFVRGEDSLVRALWANKPFVWQIYPQTDDAHHLKLEAFLKLIKAPASLHDWHQAWNGVRAGALPALALDEWQDVVSRARAQQLLQEDLVTKLIHFALENR
jgi:uncharacterized repeat protein (TIGR03837 family)